MIREWCNTVEEFNGYFMGHTSDSPGDIKSSTVLKHGVVLCTYVEMKKKIECPTECSSENYIWSSKVQ